MRLKQSEKQWKDNVRNAWEISPTLAIFLLKRLNTVNAAQVRSSTFSVSQLLSIVSSIHRYCELLKVSGDSLSISYGPNH